MYEETVAITESSQPSQPVSVTAQSASVSTTDDLSYQPSESQSMLSSSQSSVSAVSVVIDRKFLVFETQLDNLLCHLVCPICHCPCSLDDVVKKCSEGTLLRVVARCIDGNIIIDWQSQPLIGNLLFRAVTVFSGQTFEHVKNVATFLNMKFMSYTPFYDIQHTNLIPVIVETWKTH